MASQVLIMNMLFDSDDAPDFGSIYLVELKGGANLKGINEYGLFEEDVPKLDLITNAAPGSTALCDDTGNLYRLTKSGWYLVGSGSTTAQSSTNAVVSSPLIIDRIDLTDDIKPIDVSEEISEELSDG